MNDNAEHMMFILGQTAKTYGMMILARQLAEKRGKDTTEQDEQLENFLDTLNGQIDIFLQMTNTGESHE